MKIHRFFVEQPIGSSVDVVLPDAALAHQLKNVFRFREGDQVILLDNSGFEYVSEIVSVTKNGAKFHVIEKRQNASVPKFELWLYQSLIKKDNFEWILEKGTELGVAHFVPVISERSEKKDLNAERGMKILKEAGEQSGRGTLPVLHQVTKLQSAITDAEKAGVSLIAFHTISDKGVKKTTLTDTIHSLNSKKIGILVGPEGGWTDAEISFFKENKVSILNLGSQILRAETAAIAIAALILL